MAIPDLETDKPQVPPTTPEDDPYTAFFSMFEVKAVYGGGLKFVPGEPSPETPVTPEPTAE